MERRTKIIQYVVAVLTALASLIGGLLGGSTATAATNSSAVPAPAGGESTATGAEIYRGKAFDTCRTPSLGSLNAWRKSHYRAIGVYFGGRGRHCKDQPNLTRRWVHRAHRSGWGVLPIYVGSQAPCVASKAKKAVTIGSRPAAQGLREGHDAVQKASALGMRRRSALYLDMEAYNHRRAACARTVLSFVRGWSREVRRLGYLPGFYSSADSGVRHMESARKQGVKDLPAVMWFARWHTRPSVRRERALAAGAWQPHRRIHQFAGNVRERHGGLTMRIDRNMVDAPVAVVA